MSDKRRILKTSGILSVLTLLSRFTGLIRDAIIGAVVGISSLSDVFWWAFEIPNLARRVMGEGSLSVFIVPVFVERRKDSLVSAWQFVNRVLNVIGVLAIFLAALGMVFSEQMFNLMGGFGMIARARVEAGAVTPEVAALVDTGAHLTRVMFPYLFFLAIASIMMGVCNALGSFSVPALGSTTLNFAMIAAGSAALLIGIEDYAAMQWLAIAVLIGAAVRIVIMFPVMIRAGWRWAPDFFARDTGVRQIFRMMGAGIFGMSVYQINMTISGLLAGYLEPGTKSYLIYATRLIQFPAALTAAALATAMLPKLSDLVLERKDKELADVMGFVRRVEIILMTPAAFGFMLLGLPIIQLLFQYGRWNTEDSIGVYKALLFYAPGLLPLGWLRVILPIYYANKDLITPAKAATVSLAVNAILGAAFTFLTDLQQIGLAIAGTVSAYANYAYLIYDLKRTRPTALSSPRVNETLLKSLAAGALSVGIVAGVFFALIQRVEMPSNMAARAGVLLPFIALAAAVYFGIGHLLRIPDSDRALDLIKRRLVRRNTRS